MRIEHIFSKSLKKDDLSEEKYNDKCNICSKYQNSCLIQIKTINSNKETINDPILKFFSIYINSINLKLINKFTIKYYKTLILNLLFLNFNLLGFFCYEQTLLGCYLTEVECLKLNMVNFLTKLVPYFFLSCFISGIIITLSLWGRISIIHTIFIIIRYIYFYKNNHGTTLANHGQYNMIIFFIGNFCIVLIFSLFFFRKKIFQERLFIYSIFINLFFDIYFYPFL